MPGPGQDRGASALFDPSMPELTGQDPGRGEAEIKDAYWKIFDTGKLTPPDSEFLPAITPNRATPGQNWADLNTSARALDTFPRAIADARLRPARHHPSRTVIGAGHYVRPRASRTGIAG